MTHSDASTVMALTPQQAADLLGCSKVHIYRLINAEAIASVDISAPGSQRTKTRILMLDLEKYIKTSARPIQAKAP